MSLYRGVYGVSVIKLSHHAPEQNHHAQLCSHLFGYHYTQNHGEETTHTNSMANGLRVRITPVTLL